MRNASRYVFGDEAKWKVENGGMLYRRVRVQRTDSKVESKGEEDVKENGVWTFGASTKRCSH